jgi:hypothetical protein
MAVSSEPAAKVTVVRALQYLKAWLPIEVTLAGIATAISPESLNALVPMVVSSDPAAKVTVVRALQPEKARTPIDSTDVPIVTEVIAVLSLNVSSAIEINPLIVNTAGGGVDAPVQSLVSKTPVPEITTIISYT